MQKEKRCVVDPKLAPHITPMSGEIALCGLRTYNISLALILLSTIVQIKDLTFEGALDFQMGLLR